MKRVKWLLFLLPVILFPALSPSIALAETKTFNVVQDTYANLAYPDKVNGGYDHITLSNKHTDRLGYLEFEDIDLPEGAIVDQATLKVYVYSVYYASTAKLNIGPVSDGWGEGSLTWNNKPAVDQSQAIEATFDLTQGWKDFSATNLVKKWFDGSLANNGLFLYPYGFLYGTAETEFALGLRSGEHSDNQPRLEVVYHLPEPSPEPSPSPEAEVEEEEVDETEDELVIAPADEEEVTEESPSPSPEVEEEKKLVLSLTPGQAIIVGLIVLALAGAGIASFAYSQGRREKPEKKKKKEKTEEVKDEEE